MEIDVLIEDPDWQGLKGLAETACPATLSELGLDPSAYEVAILACGDGRISELNAEFRGKPAPTNVLSWPAVDLTPPEAPEPGELGDIAIAHATCAREAEAQGKPFDHHVTHLLVHATLHLLGYDHISEPEAARMEAIEVAVLARLGIPDPY